MASKQKQAEELESKMAEPDFWRDHKAASLKSQELAGLREEILKWEGLKEKISAAKTQEDILEIERFLEKEEATLYLSGPHDRSGAILTISAGAGGTDAQDWTQMLGRMYMLWAQDKNFSSKVVSVTYGAEAGIKNQTIQISGRYAFGLLRHEHGVHRLVRISPYSAQSLRHTSFAMVEVLPEITKELDFELNPAEIRVDTYRAGGPGGQYVNKTESAVRVTHLPTGLQVSSQAERSQQANRESATKLLKSRLLAQLEREQKEKIEELRGEAVPIEWGRQIRSYVLHPYQLVKDHRSDHEEGNTTKVLNGAIDGFIQAALQLDSQSND